MGLQGEKSCLYFRPLFVSLSLHNFVSLGCRSLWNFDIFLSISFCSVFAGTSFSAKRVAHSLTKWPKPLYSNNENMPLSVRVSSACCVWNAISAAYPLSRRAGSRNWARSRVTGSRAALCECISTLTSFFTLGPRFGEKSFLPSFLLFRRHALLLQFGKLHPSITETLLASVGFLLNLKCRKQHTLGLFIMKFLQIWVLYLYYSSLC
jgi:hypothetical protein